MTSFFKNLTPWTRRSTRRGNRCRSRRLRNFEPLEDRRMMAVFTVNSIGNDGDRRPGDGIADTALDPTTNTPASGETTLRAAIAEANALPGPDIIRFALPAGQKTIDVIGDLGLIVDSVTIDGGTPDADGSRAVELRAGVNLNEGFVVRAGNSVIKNLAISGFLNGITLEGDNNRVEGNFIGTNRAGTSQAARIGNRFGGTDFHGVQILGGSDNVIGGTRPEQANVLSGNAAYGVFIDHDFFGNVPTGNVVAGNYIGTDRTGTQAVGNNFHGVLVAAGTGNVIGGNDASSRNVVSGNQGVGIRLHGDGTNNNIVRGNYVGTDVSGSFAIPNRFHGVQLETRPLDITMPQQFEMLQFNTIDSNLIAGNLAEGVSLHNFGTRNNVVTGNTIGVNAAGEALGNGRHGVGIFGASNNVIGGEAAESSNLISGNGAAGVIIMASDFGPDPNNNRVVGNRIGTDRSGMLPLGNGGHGVLVKARDNTIGGLMGAGNVISSNGGEGVRLEGEFATGNRVEGNRIGTDQSGTRALGNASHGVLITGASENFIGDGTLPGNVISGNGGSGIVLQGHNTSENDIQGNSIGLDLSGALAIPNNLHGVHIESRADVAAPGGLETVESNVVQANRIAGNVLDGVAISGGGAGDTTVEANNIGLSALGDALGNGRNGVGIYGAVRNTIGDTVGNTIAFNNGAGVVVASDGTQNVISLNSIFQNDELGIDLEDDGPTANDNLVRDADDGANGRQNYPELSAVFLSDGNVRIEGTLFSVPDTDFRIEFFSNSQSDPSLYGEGETFLASRTVRTDTNGHADVLAVLPLPALPPFVTTTATRLDALGTRLETSEFSLPVAPLTDFGDAPANYPTLLADNGARHAAGGLLLGTRRDAEANGQPDANAAGDDNAFMDDEDGVTLPVLSVGEPGSAEVLVSSGSISGSGRLDAWIDFDRDGNWEASETIASQEIGAGSHTLQFNVPADAVGGTTYARFRLSQGNSQPLEPTGYGGLGEVEDYRVEIVASGAPEDVNGDGSITPIDALQIINYLNRGGDERGLDVNGDTHVTAIDALIVINQINSSGGAGESVASSLNVSGTSRFAAPPPANVGPGSVLPEPSRLAGQNPTSKTRSAGLAGLTASIGVDQRSAGFEDTRARRNESSSPEEIDSTLDAVIDAIAEDVAEAWLSRTA